MRLAIHRIVASFPLRHVWMRITFLLLGFYLCTASPVHAQVPRSISYQGLLLKNKQPVNGSVNVTFTIYDAAGQQLYQEWDQGIFVTNGIFQALIGGNSGLLPSSLRFDQQYYLGVNVDSTGEMMPRTPLAAAPYSINSQTVGGFGASSTPLPGTLLPLDANGKFPKSVFPTSGTFLTGINGVIGDAAGDVKIVSGDPATLRITQDAPNNKIIITAVPQAETGVVIANGLIGTGDGKYSGTIAIPQNALSMKIKYADIKATSNVIVTIFDPAGQTDQVSVGVITPGVGFDVHFTGYYPTPNGKLNYLVIN